MESHQLNKLFINDTPLLDVRAPIEFEKGAFPSATNLPILNNQERQEVGRCYKHAGPEQAVELGHQLVSGEVKQARIQSWIQFIRQHPESRLYCFRGGSRSQIAQRWLHENGVTVDLIPGGYKIMRQHLISVLETLPSNFRITLVGGLTGNGKTSLVRKLNAAIDLEGIAHHRGSSFGNHATPQSTQINFENQLAIQLLKHNQLDHKQLILEDEGRCIGSVDIPALLFSTMRMAPIVMIEDPLETRIERLLNEYVIQMQSEFTELYGTNDAIAHLSNYLLNALQRIRKRLGNGHYEDIRSKMQYAIQQHSKQETIVAHEAWLHALLNHYYDPMYRSQLEKKRSMIQFRGNYKECEQYLCNLN